MHSGMRHCSRFVRPTKVQRLIAQVPARPAERAGKRLQVPSLRCLSSDRQPEQKRSVQVFQFEQLVDYVEAWKWQQKYRETRIKRKIDTDVLLLLQHPPVFTLGRGATEKNLRFDPAAAHSLPVHRVERGGQVTYHGPGQIVGYPILDLHFYRQDLRWYLDSIQNLLIAVLQRYDVSAESAADLTGVWHGNHKLAAIGISASKWITTHGFSLNVNPNMQHFGLIVPCGIDDPNKHVGSIRQFSQHNPEPPELYGHIVDAFSNVFNVDCHVHRVSKMTEADGVLTRLWDRQADTPS